ncbi:MAG: hypothetical protein U1E25_07185 [Methylocystis sp.]
MTVAPSRTEHSTHRRYLALAWLPFLSAERLAKTRRRQPTASSDDAPLVLVKKSAARYASTRWIERRSRSA